MHSHKHQPYQSNPRNDRKVNINKIRQNSIRNQEEYQHQKYQKIKNQKIEKPTQVLRSELADLVKKPDLNSQQLVGARKSAQQAKKRKSHPKVLPERKKHADRVNQPKPSSQKKAKAKARKQQAKARKSESSSIKLYNQRLIAMLFTSFFVGEVAAITQSNIENKRPDSKNPSLSNKPPNTTSDGKNEKLSLMKAEKERILHEVCTNKTAVPHNKPDKVTLCAEGGEIKPLPCFKKTQCEELTSYKDFYRKREIKPNSNSEIFLKGRESNKIEYQKWMQEFQNKLNSISPILNVEQKKYFSNMAFMISKLRQMYGSEKLVQASHMGNCAEQINAAMKSLLFKKMEYGLKLKIQVIALNAAHPANKNNIQDHRFLLLDGNIPEKNIKNNPKAVEHLLSRIKSGLVCDNWNHIFKDVKDMAEAEKSLYTGEGEWHSIEVSPSIELDFSQFKFLPSTAQKFICDELKAVDFPVEFQPAACATWNPRVAEIQEQKDRARPEL
jgi:hypothetical protein